MKLKIERNLMVIKEEENKNEENKNNIINYITCKKKAIKLILEIEKRFDVSSLYYKNLQIWPIIRNSLWIHFNSLQSKLPESSLEFCKGGSLGGYTFREKKITDSTCLDSSQKENIYKYYDNHTKISGLIYNINQYIRFTKNIKSLTIKVSKEIKDLHFINKENKNIINKISVDVLFFTIPIENREKINGKIYNVSMDPIIEYISDQYKCIKIESKTNEPFLSDSYYIKPILLNIIDIQNKRTKIKNLFLKNHEKDYLKGMTELQKLISDMKENICLDLESISNYAKEILAVQPVYTRILKILKPKIVFFTDYSAVHQSAVIRACKKLNIKTVVLHHAMLPRYLAYYTDWSVIPENGYELLPDFAWCWSKQCKKNMDDSLPKNRKQLRTVVGGNLYINKFLKNNFDNMIDNDSLYNMIKDKDKDKVIVLNIQAIYDAVPESVIKVFKDSPNNWFWLIRLHPSIQKHFTQINDIFKDLGNKNYEVEKSTCYSLFKILKLADYHISCFSTLCYEALFFNVPTIFVHPLAKKLLKEDISSNIFSYANNSNELYEQLNENKSNENLPHLFETNPANAIKAIKKILEI